MSGKHDITPQTALAVRSTLTRLRRQWRTGLLLRALLRILGIAAVLLILYGLADYFFALSTGIRNATNTALIIAGLILITREFLKIAAIDPVKTARRADAISGSLRQPALTALELTETSQEGLSGFLRARTLNEAQDSLKSIRLKKWLPIPEIRTQTLVLLAQFAIAALIILANRPAARTIASRILNPAADIPPFSTWQFHITPANPSVVYGDDATISVTISGGKIDSPVLFHTRRNHDAFETICFQESSDTYAQKIEKIVQPVEFCFSLGKARSTWHKVELLLQPKISTAAAKLTPPSYSGLLPAQFAVGEQDLAALGSSEIELTITSNRPLSGGSLTIIPDDDPDNPTTISAETTANNTATFRWALHHTGLVELSVEDILGTKSAEPFKFRQRVLPDNPPDPQILSPAPFVLATPQTMIPLQGDASDDYGLRRLELVRSVSGFKDRIREVPSESHKKSASYNGMIDLALLGAEPGQTLELYLEATDYNPALTGIASSGIVRIDIIPEEEYAAMIRERTSLEEFAQRYGALSDHLSALQQSLNDLKTAAETDPDNHEKLQQLLEAAQNANAQAKDIFERMANDFPAFDVEQSLIDTAKEIAERLQNTGDQLSKISPSDPTLPQKTKEILESLGMAQQEMQEQQAIADDIAKLGQIMELAGQFRQLVAEQSSIVQRLNRFEQDPNYQNDRLLQSLSKQQTETRQRLDQLRLDMESAAAGLPADFAKLADDTRKFSESISAKGIPRNMRDASEQADNKSGSGMLHQATLALEKMQELTPEPNSGDPGEGMEGNQFSGLCRGSGIGECRGDCPGFGSTVQQMLDSINRRLRGQGDGQGSGSGQGQGFGASGGTGTGGSGFLTGGANTPLNVPIFGPERLRLSPPNSANQTNTGQSNKGNNNNSNKAPGGNTKESPSILPGPGQGTPSSNSLPPESTPEKYRNALKRYFSKEK